MIVCICVCKFQVWQLCEKLQYQEKCMPGSLCLYVSGMASSLRRTTLSRDMYDWMDHCMCMFQVWQL